MIAKNQRFAREREQMAQMVQKATYFQDRCENLQKDGTASDLQTETNLKQSDKGVCGTRDNFLCQCKSIQEAIFELDSENFGRQNNCNCMQRRYDITDEHCLPCWLATVSESFWFSVFIDFACSLLDSLWQTSKPIMSSLKLNWNLNRTCAIVVTVHIAVQTSLKCLVVALVTHVPTPLGETADSGWALKVPMERRRWGALRSCGSSMRKCALAHIRFIFLPLRLSLPF